jgi:cyanate permease
VWGVDKLNVIYRVVFLGYGLSAIVAPTLGGSIYDMTNSYTVGMFISIAVCFSGFLVYALMMPRKKVN